MWISIALLACTMAPEVRWVPGSGDHLREVAGYRVESYRDAGLGGLDWTVTGDGPSAGWEHHQLWLYDAPLEATTDLAVASDAVAFMMDGDRNDGWATFLVDGQEVGSFDMYGRRNQTLVVEGLSLRRHTLTVRVDVSSAHVLGPRTSRSTGAARSSETCTSAGRHRAASPASKPTRPPRSTRSVCRAVRAPRRPCRRAARRKRPASPP